jgi:hypothetical protein
MEPRLISEYRLSLTELLPTWSREKLKLAFASAEAPAQIRAAGRIREATWTPLAARRAEWIAASQRPGRRVRQLQRQGQGRRHGAGVQSTDPAGGRNPTIAKLRFSPRTRWTPA